MSKFQVIAFLCILSAALVKSEVNKAELIKGFLDHSEACMKEKGATKDDIDDMIKRKPSASKEAKCMRACVMMNYKMMTADGKFDKAVALEHGKILADGDAEKMKIAVEIVETCAATVAPSDPCEAAEVYGMCLKNQAVAHGVDKMEI